MQIYSRESLTQRREKRKRESRPDCLVALSNQTWCHRQLNMNFNRREVKKRMDTTGTDYSEKVIVKERERTVQWVQPYKHFRSLTTNKSWNLSDFLLLLWYYQSSTLLIYFKIIPACEKLGLLNYLFYQRMQLFKWEALASVILKLLVCSCNSVWVFNTVSTVL